MFAKVQRVHFIGIGGIGMSGIAEILLTLGYAVSGSDLRRSTITDRLETLGATIFQGHAVANVAGSGVVVTSSAIDERNVEVAEARSRKIPVIPRAEMLAELMRIKYGIAVAGMHGKTTTTSMIATVLAAGGLDPTVVVGGRVDALGSNARLGKSQYLVAEADESDRSFLKLSPILSVVTNLDREHMDCYRDLEDVDAAFLEFMNRVPFYGACTACIDNAQLAALLPRVRRRVFTYGMSPRADYAVRLLSPAEGVRSRFEVAIEGAVLGPFELHVPGKHNVLNAAAAVAIGVQLEIEGEQIAQGLRSYRGVDRRFQLKGAIRGVAVVDDYGHHPTEIRATLNAARDCGFTRVHVIFQPHRYSRTRDLMEEFATAFDDADTVQILDIYPASEEPILGIDASALIRASKAKRLTYAEGFREAAAQAAAEAAEGDVILTLGAGSVSQVAGLVLQSLAETAASSTRPPVRAFSV
jgi:UDP-N-acetylmuramate--alanine ligase